MFLIALATAGLAFATPCPYEPVADDSSSPRAAEGTVDVDITNLQPGVTATVSIDGWRRRPDENLRFVAVCTFPNASYKVRVRFKIDDDGDGDPDRTTDGSSDWTKLVVVQTGKVASVSVDATPWARQIRIRIEEPQVWAPVWRPDFLVVPSRLPVAGLAADPTKPDPTRLLALNAEIAAVVQGRDGGEWRLATLHYEHAQLIYQSARSRWLDAGGTTDPPRVDFADTIEWLDAALAAGDPAIQPSAAYLLAWCVSTPHAVQFDAERAEDAFRLVESDANPGRGRQAHVWLAERYRRKDWSTADEPKAHLVRATHHYEAAYELREEGWLLLRLAELAWRAGRNDDAIAHLARYLVADARGAHASSAFELMALVLADVSSFTGSAPVDAVQQHLRTHLGTSWFASVLERLAEQLSAQARHDDAIAVFEWLQELHPYAPRNPEFQSRSAALAAGLSVPAPERVQAARARLVGTYGADGDWARANQSDAKALARARELVAAARESVPEQPEVDIEGQIAMMLRGRTASCLERAVHEEPSIAGRVTTYFDVRAGKATGVTTLEDNTGSTTVARCLERLLSSTDLHGLTAPFHAYTFTFEAADGWVIIRLP